MLAPCTLRTLYSFASVAHDVYGACIVYMLTLCALGCDDSGRIFPVVDCPGSVSVPGMDCERGFYMGKNDKAGTGVKDAGRKKKTIAAPAPLMSMLIGYILLTYLATLIAILIGSDTTCIIMFVILSVFGMVIYLVYNRERENALMKELERENKALHDLLVKQGKQTVIIPNDTILEAEESVEETMMGSGVEQVPEVIITEQDTTAEEEPAQPAATTGTSTTTTVSPETEATTKQVK